MKNHRATSLAIVLAVITGLLTLGHPSAKAAFTPDFDELLGELQARSLVLSNSTDKVEQKQKKTCDKAIKDINKAADSLADDVKTAAKVVKALEKSFPAEFSPTLVSQFSIPSSNNLAVLVGGLIDALQTDILDALTNLQTSVDALPAGTAKTKAQAAIVSAQAALAMADVAPDSSALFRALGSALKSIANGQKAVNSAGGGGGGGGGAGMTATIVTGGGNINWVADNNIGAEWVQSSGILDIGGQSAAQGSSLNVALCSGFNGQTGTYPIQATCGGYMVSSPFDFYSSQSGTLNITTFNPSTHTLVCTYTITANDGTNSITITGSANLNNLTVTP